MPVLVHVIYAWYFYFVKHTYICACIVSVLILGICAFIVTMSVWKSEACFHTAFFICFYLLYFWYEITVCFVLTVKCRILTGSLYECLSFISVNIQLWGSQIWSEGSNARVHRSQAVPSIGYRSSQLLQVYCCESTDPGSICRVWSWVLPH